MFIFHSMPSQYENPCPKCGMSLLRSSGRLGCPDCYAHFAERLAPYIKRVHGTVSHTGHIPASAGEEIVRQRKISELSEALSEAVYAQEFEKCAALRDEINALKSKDGVEQK